MNDARLSTLFTTIPLSQTLEHEHPKLYPLSLHLSILEYLPIGHGWIASPKTWSKRTALSSRPGQLQTLPS